MQIPTVEQQVFSGDSRSSYSPVLPVGWYLKPSQRTVGCAVGTGVSSTLQFLVRNPSQEMFLGEVEAGIRGWRSTGLSPPDTDGTDHCIPALP